MNLSNAAKRTETEAEIEAETAAEERHKIKKTAIPEKRLFDYH